MGLLTFGISAQCKNKEHPNQDRFGSITVKSPTGKNVLVAAVSDGVTMCYKGEIAAYNTIRFILNWAAEYFPLNEFNPSEIAESFDELIIKINQYLNHYSRAKNKKAPKDGYSQYTSCTLCCVITDGDRILHFGVGDSLIYELKPYSTTNILSSNKHTNASGQLTSYIGGIADDKLDIRYIEGRFDDLSVYCLCTDGMSNKMVWNIDADENFRKFNQRLQSINSRNNGIDVLTGMAEYVISKGETDDITALVIKGVKV